MNEHNDSVYFNHILDAINQTEEYLKDLDKESFMEYPLARDGVIRQLEIIGEAAKNISDTTKELAPDVPWVEIVGMRNKLIHEYFGVDLDAVWETVQKDLPPLKKAVEKLLD